MIQTCDELAEIQRSIRELYQKSIDEIYRCGGKVDRVMIMGNWHQVTTNGHILKCPEPLFGNLRIDKGIPVKRIPGTSFGPPDAPAADSSYELSRLMDAMDNALMAGIKPDKVFELASRNLKMQYNYSRWNYITKDECYES